jgi:hypothetical protein
MKRFREHHTDRPNLEPHAGSTSGDDALIGRVAATLRAVPVPDLGARVAAAIHREQPAAAPAGVRERLRVAAEWLLAPATVRVRPAFAFAASLAVLLFAALPYADFGSEAAPSAQPQTVLVQFRLDAPGAASVALAGSFTGWESRVELMESAPGVWTARVAVPPGVHDYLFVVDGEWTSDPAAPEVPDGFGGSNSRMFLPAAPAAT